MNMNTNPSKSNNGNAGKKMNPQNAGNGGEVGIQEKIMKQIRDLGDSLERAGEKVEKSGWEKIGSAISKLGNTLEHLNDKKNDNNNKSFSENKPYSDNEFQDKSKKFSDTKTPVTKVGEGDSQAV